MVPVTGSPDSNDFSRLIQAARRRVEAADQRLRSQRQSLELVSPLAVLARGYAIVQDSAGRVLFDEDGLAAGDGLQIRLARAEVQAAVIRAQPLPAVQTDDRPDSADD